MHSNDFGISIEKAKILDIYSGTGSFGLECISRGAGKVTFIENNNQALNILNKNIKNLSVLNQTQIIKKEIENINLSNLFHKYQIIFLDPPFKDNKFINVLEKIKESQIFSKKHLIIIHRERNYEDNFLGTVRVIKEKNYGRSKIIFCVFM